MATRHGSWIALTIALTVLVFGGFVPRLAHAQDYDAAGKHFAAGQERFSQQKFHTAAMEFQSAYDITKDPVLLYNIGESWQKAGQTQKATVAYRAYLKERADAKDRADVNKRIQQLESKKQGANPDQSIAGDKDEAAQWLAAGGAPQPAPPAPVPAPVVEEKPPEPAPVPPPPVVAPEPTPAPKAEPPKPAEAPPMQIGLLDDRPASRLRIAAWASVAATIALVTTGAILGLAAQSRADEVSRRLNFVDSSGQPREFDAGAKSDFQSLKDEGHLYNGLAIGFYSLSAAMAVTTTVLFVVDWKQGKKKKAAATNALRFAPSLAPGAAGIVVGGAF